MFTTKPFFLVLSLWTSLMALPSLAQTDTPSKARFFYLRCNATGWDMKSEALNWMAPGLLPDTYEITISVTESWMLTAGDDCTVTETNAFQGWGNAQQGYRFAADKLQVPGATWLVKDYQVNSESPHIRLKFPKLGLYKATFHAREMLFTVMPQPPAPHIGEMKWALPGLLIRGKDSQLYRQNQIYDAAQNSFEGLLASVDSSTGWDRWQYRKQDSRLSLSENCAKKDSLFVAAGNQVIALSPTSGQELWKRSMNPEPSSQLPNITLACPQNDALLFVSFGSIDKPTFAVLSEDGGRELWRVADYSLLFSEAYTDQMVILYRDIYSAPDSLSSYRTFAAYDRRSGRELWTLRTSSESAFYVSPDGELYISSQSSLRRISAADGSTQWEIDTASQWLSPRFEKSGLYTLSNSTLQKLNKATGQIDWSYNSSSKSYLYSLFLNNGHIFVKDDHSAVYLASESGQALWTWDGLERDESFSIYTDKEDRLYVSQAADLHRLAPEDGRELWRYSLPGFNPRALPPERMSYGGIASSDQLSLYMTYNGPGYRCQPMSLVALDLVTGKEQWQRKHSNPIWVAGHDATQLLVVEGCRGPSFFSSIQLHP